MKHTILLALFGLAVIATLPASASTANFNFLNCGTAGNPGCSSNLSSYAVSSTGVTGITATATAFYVVGTSSGPTGTNTLTSGAVGSYTGNGLGICENGTQTGAGQNCGTPNHQVNNSANSGFGQDFEFMLIQFTGAAVNLSDIQLGNYGGGGPNPFAITYFTSSNTSLSTPLASMTYSQLLGGSDGFSPIHSSSCSSGALLDQTVQSVSSANCTTEAIDTLNGTNVTYLLVGASVDSANVGKDFFKIQDLDVTKFTATPEPATFGLIGIALAGIGLIGRKRQS